VLRFPFSAMNCMEVVGLSKTGTFATGPGTIITRN
jgi:hypothetical protein